MISSRKLILIILFSFPLLVFISQCSYFNKTAEDPRGKEYAGAVTCIKCHKNIYNNYLHTAHFISTRLTDEHNLSGSFQPGSNTFVFRKDLKVVIENRDSGLCQVAYKNGKVTDKQRFDITFGGVKAESYLYWKGNELYQLPISYFKAIHRWTNSPGYDSTIADYSRHITIGCLECHSSYIKGEGQQGPDSMKSSAFNRGSLLTGIDCERCHGPAGDHVYYQTTHPDDKQAKYIITYSSLSRQQKINMCAVCHSGSKGTMLRSTFKFKPNDNLTDYKLEDIFQTTDPGRLDVHGDQSRLLASSKCFIMSNMNCTTCHDVHASQRNQLALFSQRCMSCHTEAKHNFCKMAPMLGAVIKTNCIDCHMPAKPSNIIAVGTSATEKVVPYYMRTHYIAIYREEIAKVIMMLESGQKK